ncbi:hypothetical protein ACQJBY_025218 [Aegilops geniculata]
MVQYASSAPPWPARQPQASRTGDSDTASTSSTRAGTPRARVPSSTTGPTSAAPASSPPPPRPSPSSPRTAAPGGPSAAATAAHLFLCKDGCVRPQDQGSLLWRRCSRGCSTLNKHGCALLPKDSPSDVPKRAPNEESAKGTTSKDDAGNLRPLIATLMVLHLQRS